MTVQYSDTLRHALLEAIELTCNGQTLSAGTGTGASVSGTASQPLLQIWSGTKPTNCGTATGGGNAKLVEMTLPADWMSAAGASVTGRKDLNGTWQGTGTAAASTGTTATFYRIVSGTTCHEQGTITATGGGGDMTLDNTSIATGQTVTVTSKQITAPNA
jgi:hypothetical protein